MATKRRETLVLLDTHAIIHRAYHALPPLTAPTGEPVGAVYGLLMMLLKLITELKPDHVVAAYDLPGPTHRHEVYEAYKGTRPKLEEDLTQQIARSRDALRAFGVPVYEAPGFEADDVIGTIATSAKKNFDVIIASGDMDTLQLVDGTRVRVYTLRKGIQDTVLYDEDAVRARFGFGPGQIPDFKGIAGDASDNIVGIPGVGEKGATELITQFGSLEKVYRALAKDPNAVVARGMRARLQQLVAEHEDEAEFSKVLATIRTDAPISFVEPERSFFETFDGDRAAAFCAELGFRSLVPRIQKLQTAETVSRAVMPSGEVLHGTQQHTQLFKECQVMVWLLNSETTNPTADDIVAVSRERDIVAAHARLESLITKADLTRVYRTIEQPLISVVDALNRRGVRVDSTELAALSQAYHAELCTLEQQIFDVAGEKFNINSPKQLGAILFDKLGLGGSRQKKTATGQVSTRESELVKLAGKAPIIDLILQYRERAKLLGTYIDAIPPLLDQSGRLHTTFSQTGTTTGRISSRDPNLQNIPIKTDLGRRIRQAFVAPEGMVLLACDYSQIELRLAAILSGDEKLGGIFMRGEDVHAAVAARVFGVDESAVTKEMRRRAKVINFGILYGMGVNALREQLGTDRAEAQDFMNKYFETFETLARYLEKTRETVARTGYTTTLFGRRRYFPGMQSSVPFIRAAAERMAINAPLQGTQADMIKLAMVRIHDHCATVYGDVPGIVLQIHDELVLEVPEKEQRTIAEAVVGIMTEVLPRADTAGIPITVSAEVGRTWGSMHPLYGK